MRLPAKVNRKRPRLSPLRLAGAFSYSAYCAKQKKIIVSNLKGYSTESVAEFIFAAILEQEKVAFDVKGYNAAPPSFRVWCGLTVEEDDLKVLCEWFEYTYKISCDAK